MVQADGIETIAVTLALPRQRLLEHAVFSRLGSIADLRTFLEHYVFAGWDHLSLLKALQRHCTCIELPWAPQGEPAARRLLNALVLMEESDAGLSDESRGGESSYEQLLAVMREAEADTSPVEWFVERVRQGDTVDHALRLANVPIAAQHFLRNTWATIRTGCAASIAGAFVFGREMLTAELLQRLSDAIDQSPGNSLPLLRETLRRRLRPERSALTAGAPHLLAQLCSGDAELWHKAEAAAVRSLDAWVELCDGIVTAIESRNADWSPTDAVTAAAAC